MQSCWTGAERDVQCQDVDLSSAAGCQQRIQHQINSLLFTSQVWWIVTKNTRHAALTFSDPNEARLIRCNYEI